jgi:hypothetical protein
MRISPACSTARMSRTAASADGAVGGPHLDAGRAAGDAHAHQSLVPDGRDGTINQVIPARGDAARHHKLVEPDLDAGQAGIAAELIVQLADARDDATMAK